MVRVVGAAGGMVMQVGCVAGQSQTKDGDAAAPMERRAGQQDFRASDCVMMAHLLLISKHSPEEVSLHS